MAGTTQYFGISYPTATDYVKDGASNMQTIATGFDTAVAIPTYNNQTGTTYTFVLADAAKTVTSNNASAVTFTIPPQSSVAWATGTTLKISNFGAGAITFVGGSGVTVTNTATTVPQYGEASLVRTGSDAWTVVAIVATSPGLTQIVPTSITKGASGSASVRAGGTIPFSGTESISANGCFSATYDNYIFVYNITSVGADIDTYLRFRTGTTDNTTTNYDWSILYYNNTGSGDANSQMIIGISDDNSSYVGANGQILITSPYLSQRTFVSGLSSGSKQGYAGGMPISTGGHFRATTSFDGFTFYPNTSTFGGTLRIYGYKNG